MDRKGRLHLSKSTALRHAAWHARAAVLDLEEMAPDYMLMCGECSSKHASLPKRKAHSRVVMYDTQVRLAKDVLQERWEYGAFASLSTR